MSSKTLVLATNNSGKVSEISDLLIAQGYQISSQAEHGMDSIEETGLTFVENALLKARHICNTMQTAALGDDSGLVVPALQGAPGLYSARYAGSGANDTDNNHKLLKAMLNLHGIERKASFICTLALLQHSHDPEPIIAIGRWHGHIATQLSGSQGFGYDPLFIPNGFELTAAELAPSKKRIISHRGLALQSLFDQLKESTL